MLPANIKVFKYFPAVHIGTCILILHLDDFFLAESAPMCLDKTWHITTVVGDIFSAFSYSSSMIEYMCVADSWELEYSPLSTLI